MLDAGEADLAKAEKSLAALVSSQASVKGFVEESMELAGATPCSNRRRVELRSWIHSRSSLVCRTDGRRRFGRHRGSHTARSGQEPHTPGGTIFVVGYREPKINYGRD